MENNLIILMYIFLAIFAGLVYWRPHVGGYAIVALLPSYLLRAEFFSIPTTLLELMIGIWFVVTLLYAFREKKIHTWIAQLKQPLINNYVLFIALGLLAVFWAADMRLAAGAWKGWMLGPLIFLFTALYHYRSVRYIPKLIAASMVSVGGVVVWGLVEYIGGFGMQIPGFVNSFFTSANYGALFIIPLWLLALGWSLQRWYEKKVFTKELVLWLLFHAVCLVTIVLTRSYAGLLAVGAAGLFILLSLPKDLRFRKEIYGIVVGLAVVLFGFVVLDGKLDRFFDDSRYNSFETRQQIWNVTTDLITSNIVFGIGFGNFEPEYYHRAFELYSPPLEWEVPRAHNVFLHTWVEMGVVGFGLFVLLLIQMFVRLQRALFVQPRRLLVVGVIAALLGFVVHGMLDTPYYKNDLSIIFVMLLLFTHILYTRGDDEEQIQDRISKSN